MAENELKFDSLPDPGKRYKLSEKLGSGVYSEVYAATDSQAGDKRVAIKIISVTNSNMDDIREEYRVLKELSSHPNLPDLYGVFLKRDKDSNQLWFVMELCDGGPITDLVDSLSKQGRKMSEEHIAYILKEVVKALMHLHENHVMHRDVKGSNILLTKEGEVKLVDFGLARELASTMAKSSTCLGSPCWMAPEVVASGNANSYDNRADVWALGIVAIELGDGKPPFHDMHPTRALFQIMRNPPPTLYRPANWSKLYNDFITECLEKNPEHRPYMVELIEHPFLEAVPQNDYHLQQEIRTLNDEVKRSSRDPRTLEVAVRDGRLHSGPAVPAQEMRVEDLAALEQLSEDAVLHEVHERYKQGQIYTFVGDVLLASNPNEHMPIYSSKHHFKYQFKSRSDNAPHIFAVADRAYQDVLHHEEQQSIVLAGESLSGKTTQLGHLVHHLAFLGKMGNNIAEKVDMALEVVQALGNAATPLNRNSSRHILLLQTTFTRTGKLSGAIVWVFQLEKWRVSIPDKQQGNFHIFYYMYDGLEAAGKLEKYNLESNRQYRYLRRGDQDTSENEAKFRKFQENMKGLELEEDVLHVLWSSLAAILLIGELEFTDSGSGEAVLHNTDMAAQVAALLGVDEKKFCWALVNYCVVEQGTAQRRRHTPAEAIEARDVLAAGLYMRVVDWIINLVNWRLSFSRAVYGDTHVINILDLFGFEGFKKNSIEQLFVNTMNEQLQYHYNQHVFAWEMQEQLEEELPVQPLHFQDNKPTLDALLIKPDGLLYLLDSNGSEAEELIASVRRTGRGPHLGAISSQEFSVAHYTGTVTYDAQGMMPKNKDFLPPDIMEVLRQSTDPTIQTFFSARLSRTGNLTMEAPAQAPAKKPADGKRRWGAALVNDSRNLKKYNTASRGQFSQTHRMRTAAAVFRATSLEVLRLLSTGGVHFVRCVRSDLAGQPRGFQPELVRQQLRALAVLDTAKARQNGHPCRVPFAEFIRRYKFLAFDFDETVEETKENSRLLLIRLKMEGWVMGKSKVFLTYYNEEYLSRLYETQVKKIVRVQAMMRAFLARRNVQRKSDKEPTTVEKERGKDKEKKVKSKGKGKNNELDEETAAIIIQKQFRGYQVRKELGPMLTSQNNKMDEDTATFIKQFCNRWKARTIFQVLLLYRAARHQDLVYFSQQAHLYNQHVVSAMQSCNSSVNLKNVDPAARASTILGQIRPPVRKLPFRLHELPFFDTSPFCGMIPRSPDMLFSDQRAARLSCESGQFNTDTIHSGPGEDVCNNTKIQWGREECSIQGEQAVTTSTGLDTPLLQTNNNSKQSYNAMNNSSSQSEKRPASYARNQQTDNNNWDFPGSPSPTNKPTSYSKQDHNVPKAFNQRNPGMNHSKNPILEMEMRGRHVNADSDDAPPFNFQGMLRKTNHNRASLKRAGHENDTSRSYYPLATTPEKPEKESGSHYSPISNKSQKENKVTKSGYNSGSANYKQSPKHDNMYYPASQPGKRSNGDNNETNDTFRMERNNSTHRYLNNNNRQDDMINRNERNDENMTTELAPGIIVQGQVAEL